MENIRIIDTEKQYDFCCGQDSVIKIKKTSGCVDSFTEIGEGAYLWRRETDTPTDKMDMSFYVGFDVLYTMVPCINFNGNGWGTGVEYRGYECEGKPWTYSYSRTPIPACTYSEGERYAVALMGDRDIDPSLSCSQYPTDDGMRHSLLWPEQEGPYALCKQRMKEAHSFPMQPKSVFCGVIFISEATSPRHSWHALFDFAWEYYAHSVKSHFDSAQLWKLGCNYAKILYTEEPDGFRAFSIGLEWKASESQYIKRWFATKYELGWCGQNISLSNALLANYLKTGDKDSLSKAEAVIDSWLKYCRLDNGMMIVTTNVLPTPETYQNKEIDACNLGTGALHFFEAYDLLLKCGIDKPACIDAALGICDFALRSQDGDGAFAKSWNVDGSIKTKSGSVGCFFVPALLAAHRYTGEQKYLDSAQRAMGFYYGDFARDGYTTAGALDSYCIDKESASPVLSACILLYEHTNKPEYLEMARNLAYYIGSWQWHYSVVYPENTILHDVKFETCGSTGVSTSHNGLDHYALHDVVSFVKLAKITGEEKWLERAKAFWANATQLISDGTLVVNGRTRVAGSQDEAICHCRWERMRAGGDFFVPTQWLVAWPCAFRLEIMRQMDTTLFDQGFVKEQNK